MEHYDPRKLPELPELMIAGPGELHEEDLDVLGHQVIAHYGAVWTELHQDVVAAMGALLGAQDPPYIIPGSGTACLDAAALNLFERGQKVVIPRTGFFGTRLMEIAHAHGLEVIEVPVEPGAAVDPARVGEAAAEAEGVMCVHVETATGVRHPVESITAAAHDAGAICVVDGIASVGGELVNVDAMDIDCLVTGSQKGLEAPPGLGILALGAGGRARLDARNDPPGSFYLDLKRWDWYRREWGEWHPHPVTMPTNLILAMASSLERIQEAGLAGWVGRRAELAARCRTGLTDLGLKPVPHEGVEANLVVAFWADDPTAIQGHLMAQEGIMISGGLEPTASKAIRIGLMGRTATEDMVDRLVAGVGAALER